YGDDIRRDCHLRVECTDRGWSVPVVMACEPLPMAMCPDSREAAAGEECDTMDAFCDYDGLVCHCTNCREFPVQGCNGPPIWMCDAPNLDDECPTSWPRLGSRCTNE